MGRISERKRTSRKEESPRFVRKPSGGRSSSRSSGRSRDSGSRFNRRDSDRGSRDRPSKRSQMQAHTVTCDKCSKRCEVPFMPTSSKPVYCSDCYRVESKGSSKGNKNIDAELQSIHKKLDRILDLLEM